MDAQCCSLDQLPPVVDLPLYTTDSRTDLSDQGRTAYLQSLVQNLAPFTYALHLYPTVEAVVEHNVTKLKDSNLPIATIKAVHTGANTAKASLDDASGFTCHTHQQPLGRSWPGQWSNGYH